MALGSNQTLTEMSNILWEVKAAGAWSWQTYHLHLPIVMWSESLNHLEHSGPLQASTRIALPLHLPHESHLTHLQNAKAYFQPSKSFQPTPYRCAVQFAMIATLAVTISQAGKLWNMFWCTLDMLLLLGTYIITWRNRGFCVATSCAREVVTVRTEYSVR